MRHKVKPGALWLGMLVLAAGAAAFLWMGARLLRLRLERGGYPAYSSRRTDTAGSALLAQTLRMAGLRVSPMYRLESYPSGPAARQSFVFVLAPQPVLPPRLLRAWLNYLHSGGALLLASHFTPRVFHNPLAGAPAGFDFGHVLDVTWSSSGKKTPPVALRSPAKSARPVSLLGSLGKTARAQAQGPIDKYAIPRSHESGRYWAYPAAAGSPPLPLDSLIYLKLSTPAWRVLYRMRSRSPGRQGLPVFAERRMGAGRLFVTSDLAVFSNQVIGQGKVLGLVATLLGRRRDIRFDETVHGMTNQHGFPWLIHQAGLLPALALWIMALLAAAAAQAFALLPPPAAAAGEPAAADPMYGSQAAAVALLRRAIPRSRLLEACRQAFRPECAVAASAPAPRQKLSEAELVAGFLRLEAELAPPAPLPAAVQNHSQTSGSRL